ncbi:Ribosomal protein S18 acetylase RimI [Ferrimonas sediminum]|uniref:Ribosomal protein S18 acetylase RimI n=1 Tax=Ferrimonas sediminum TaxID=718193 RepID=A0A1G8VNR0_9GAMM|nr:GNAT family N-acetyltransferase [Ferrimonas sediminum]SDJ67594.1 Ribosomal protein S18 acetylase RimI [Ferrimonas sediminum]
MSPIQLRLARHHDIAAIQSVRLSVTENRLSHPGSVTDTEVLNYLSRRGRGWVCTMEQRVVAFVIANGSDGSIWALYVLPEYEGRGIGKLLLARACRWLFAIGVKAIRLRTDTNSRAHGFYQHLGWQARHRPASGDVTLTLKRRPLPVRYGASRSTCHWSASRL